MDGAVLFTMGTLLGGLALDLGAGARRLRTARRQVIQILSDSIRAGTFGPLRLAEYHDGLYLVGCGLKQPVDSAEQAELLVVRALDELRRMLEGLDLSALMNDSSPPADKEDCDQPPTDVADEMFRDMVKPPVAEETQWRDLTGEPQTPRPEPAAVAAAVTQTVETPPAQATTAPPAPATKEPIRGAVTRGTRRTRMKRPVRRIRMTQVDETLRDIIHHMKSCGAAARRFGQSRRAMIAFE